MIITIGRNKEVLELTETVRSLRREVAELRIDRDAEREALRHQETINALRTELNNLRIDESQIHEAHARERRELEHMIGLERQRQTQEVAAATRDAKLGVREENLSHERTQFEKQMAFREKQFDGQVNYLKSLMEQILKRLPTVEVTAKR